MSVISFQLENGEMFQSAKLAIPITLALRKFAGMLKKRCRFIPRSLMKAKHSQSIGNRNGVDTGFRSAGSGLERESFGLL